MTYSTQLPGPPKSHNRELRKRQNRQGRFWPQILTASKLNNPAQEYKSRQVSFFEFFSEVQSMSFYKDKGIASG